MIHGIKNTILLTLFASAGLWADPAQLQYTLRSEDEVITWNVTKSSKPIQSTLFVNDEEGRHVVAMLALQEGDDVEDKAIQSLVSYTTTTVSPEGETVTTKCIPASKILETKIVTTSGGLVGNSSLVALTDDCDDEERCQVTTFQQNGKGYIVATMIEKGQNEEALIQAHKEIVNSLRVSISEPHN